MEMHPLEERLEALCQKHSLRLRFAAYTLPGVGFTGMLFFDGVIANLLAPCWVISGPVIAALVSVYDEGEASLRVRFVLWSLRVAASAVLVPIVVSAIAFVSVLAQTVLSG